MRSSSYAAQDIKLDKTIVIGGPTEAQSRNLTQQSPESTYRNATGRAAMALLPMTGNPTAPALFHLDPEKPFKNTLSQGSLTESNLNGDSLNIQIANVKSFNIGGKAVA